MTGFGVLSPVLTDKQKAWIVNRSWFWTDRDNYADGLVFNEEHWTLDAKRKRDNRHDECIQCELVSEPMKEINFGKNLMREFVTLLEPQMQSFSSDEPLKKAMQ